MTKSNFELGKKETPSADTPVGFCLSLGFMAHATELAADPNPG